MRLGFFIFLGLFFLPAFAFAGVVINEIAWMGTIGNQYGEWIELYNNSNEEIDLNNWKLYEDGGNVLIFTLTKKITPSGYLVIERTTDSSPDPLPDINDESGKFGGGGFVNLPGGEYLVLKDSVSNIIEDLNFSTGWPAGDNTTKQTMQKTGSGWITATATPKAANFSLPEPPPPQQPESQPSGGSSSQYIPPENLPKIKAYAGEDKTVIVGAASEFRGQAFGLDNQPLDSARFLWTFGDGTFKEGQNITHTYQYPGDYIVVLNVSSGQYSASDTMLVKALPNQLFISEAKPGFAGWIELNNASKEQIDISGCQLKSENQIFIFPKSTFIRPNTYLVVSFSVSGIILPEGKGAIELLYPGGFKADSFSYEGSLKDGQSFSRDGSGSVITKETPAKENLISKEKPSALSQEKSTTVAAAQSSENQKRSPKRRRSKKTIKILRKKLAM